MRLFEFADGVLRLLLVGFEGGVALFYLVGVGGTAEVLLLD